MFDIHQKQIQFEASESPETMAKAIIFAIVSAKSRFVDTINTMHYLDAVLGYKYYELSTPLRNICATGLHTKKLEYVNQVWDNRYELHKLYLEMDAIEFWHYLIDNVKGVAMVKSAFAVQMLYGKLACLDVHNLREGNIDPKIVKSRTKKARIGYLAALRKTSKDYWDDWCNLVAKKEKLYQNGSEVSELHSLVICS